MKQGLDDFKLKLFKLGKDLNKSENDMELD